MSYQTYAHRYSHRDPHLVSTLLNNCFFIALFYEPCETGGILVFIASVTSPETHYLTRCGLIIFKCIPRRQCIHIFTYTQIFALQTLSLQISILD